jgi:hypothetical protein
LQRSRALAVVGAVALVAGATFAALKWPARKDAAGPKPGAGGPPATAWVTDIGVSEEFHDRASGQVKATFVKGLRERNWALAAAGLTADFRGSFPAPESGRAVPDHAFGLREYDPAPPQLDRTAFLEVLRAHSERWTHVERTTWRIFEFLLDPSRESAAIRLHFQLAGPLPGGGRGDVQAILAGELVLDGETWKARRLEMTEGCRIENPRPPFRDITDETGFHFNESEENRRNAQAIINSRGIKTSGGLACVDWNRDGFPDVLATVANRQTVLFLNDGKGGFVRGDSPVKSPGDSPYTFLSVDLDNDGEEELVGAQVLGYEGKSARLELFAKGKEGWSEVKGALDFRIRDGARAIVVQSLGACDIDGNGFLDVFAGCYSNSDSGLDRFNAISAHDGADSLLFMNHGGMKFTEESDERGITGTRYTLASQFFDFDFDGHTDLFQGNDFGEDFLWLNDGKGQFHEAKNHILARDPTYTMGVTISDWENTGEWSVYISNMYSHAGNRIVPLAGGISDTLKQMALVIAHGNQLFEHDSKSGSWKETSNERAVAWADWAWACHFFDFDNDTDKDLFVANGYTSNEVKDTPDW